MVAACWMIPTSTSRWSSVKVLLWRPFRTYCLLRILIQLDTKQLIFCSNRPIWPLIAHMGLEVDPSLTALELSCRWSEGKGERELAFPFTLPATFCMARTGSSLIDLCRLGLYKLTNSEAISVKPNAQWTLYQPLFNLVILLFWTPRTILLWNFLVCSTTVISSIMLLPKFTVNIALMARPILDSLLLKPSGSKFLHSPK